MKVWLDDVREMPSNFDIHVKTANEAIALLKTGNVICISLDHDLGDHYATCCGTGYQVAKFIEEKAHLGTLPKLQWFIHSANPVGRKNMIAALQRADLYWSRYDKN